MKNIIVSAGHGNGDPGAVNEKLGLLEHLHAYQIAWYLRAALEEKSVSVEFISCFQGLSSKIRNVNERHAAKPVDLAIEVHFNSVESPLAHGTEVPFYSPKLEPLAARISKSLSGAIGTFDRGAKKRVDLGWLKQIDRCPALIVEVCFISSPEDVAIMSKAGFHALAAKGIAGGI